MLDPTTILGLVLGFSALNFVLGYVLGHYGLAAIKAELTTIKELISGQEKVTVTTPTFTVPANIITTPAIATTAGMA